MYPSQQPQGQYSQQPRGAQYPPQQQPNQQPQRQPTQKLQSNFPKLMLFGGALIILSILTLMFLFSGDDSTDAPSTGFVLFGADPELLSTCENDLNESKSTIALKTNSINLLDDKINNLNTDIFNCKSAKDQCLTDANATGNALLTCNSALSSSQSNYSACDANLITTKTNLTSVRVDYNACLIDKNGLAAVNRQLSTDLNSARQQATNNLNSYNTCLSDKNAALQQANNFMGLYNACSPALSTCQQKTTITNTLIFDINGNVTDFNSYDLSDMSSRLISIKNSICVYDANYC